jgi:hypothetical protein
LHKLSGTNPVSILCARSNLSTFFNPERLLGKIPDNEFDAASKTVTFSNNPMLGGKHPERSLFKKMISFSVLVIFPMLLGMHPSSLLLARTTTEAGEFPRVSGMLYLNLLLLKNNASSSFSKTSGGR